ncbi:MAG TPA: radical SAM protein [archaeon]|nr:radical SAM protein [archaeon]
MRVLTRPDAVRIIHDDEAVTSLTRYFDVFQNRKKAKFILARKLSANFTDEYDLDKLWKIHADLTNKYYDLEAKIDSNEMDFEALSSPKKSYLDLKIEIARRIMENCHLCERKCGVNRLKDELGFCRCGPEINVSTMFEHLGEEASLVPSFTIFTCGCTVYCVHCQNWSIARWYEEGNGWTPRDIAKAIDRARASGCRNANLVGGEPTPWLEQWLEVFKHVESNVPIVWNSNTWYSQDTAELLAGFADVYLNDFKYGNNVCAVRISSAPKYFDVCTNNMLSAKKYGELLIRVLVLPGHLECCTKEILHWIAKNLGKETRVNVMWQYRPEFEYNKVPELGRRLTREEKQRSCVIAKEAGLESLEPFSN